MVKMTTAKKRATLMKKRTAFNELDLDDIDAYHGARSC